MPRAKLTLLPTFLVLGLVFWFLPRRADGSASVPNWAAHWPAWPAEEFDAAGGRPGLGLGELSRILEACLQEPAGYAGSGPPVPVAACADDADYQDREDYLRAIHESIRASEREQREASLADWSAALEELVAERLGSARALWEERLRELGGRLAAADEVFLSSYAAEISRKDLPLRSSLQFQIALTDDPERKRELERQLADLSAAAAGRIADKRRELLQKSDAEMAEARRQAEAALAALAERLQTSVLDALAAFRMEQEKALAAWAAADMTAEFQADKVWSGYADAAWKTGG